MKSIVKDNNVVEFTDGLESFFIADIEGSIRFYYFGHENEMIVSKEDYILFDATRKLFEGVKEQAESEERLHVEEPLSKLNFFKNKKQKKRLFNNNKIEIHSTFDRKDKENLMYLSKMDDDRFKYIFFLEDKASPCVEINYNVLSKKDIYEPYTKHFVDFFCGLYNEDLNYHQMNIEEYEYALKLKK